jgi:hypothetical protein
VGVRRLVVITVIVSAVLAVPAAVAASRTASAAFLHGYKCIGVVRLFANHTKLTLADESKWDTDSWHDRPPSEILPAGKIEPKGGVGRWESRGGVFRGCHNDVRYHTHGHGTLEFTITKPYSGIESWDCRNLNGGPGCHSTRRTTTDTSLSVTFVVDLP